MLDPDHLGLLDAIVRAVDPRYRCEASGGAEPGLTVEVVMDDVDAPVAEEVAMAGFSTGTDFSFEDRGTPVELRIG